jgi:membrane-bound lytic murein transglycosylase F
MPGTAGDVGRALNIDPDHFWLPEVSIRASGYYMARMIRTWKAERPAFDRYKLALASYNAGAGHLIKAQRLCGGKNLYDQIIACLPDVTGRHSKETIDYTRLITEKWYPRLVFD